jgi:hypothetical protein
MLIFIKPLHGMDDEARTRMHKFLHQIGFVGKKGKLSDITIKNFKCGNDLHELTQNLVSEDQLTMLMPILLAVLKKEHNAQEAYQQYVNRFNVNPAFFRLSIQIKERYAANCSVSTSKITNFLSKERATELLAPITMDRANILQSLERNNPILLSSNLFFPGALVSLSTKELSPGSNNLSKRDKRNSLSPDILRRVNSTHLYTQLSGSIIKKISNTEPTKNAIPIIPSIIEHSITIYAPNVHPVVSAELLKAM